MSNSKFARQERITFFGENKVRADLLGSSVESELESGLVVQ